METKSKANAAPSTRRLNIPLIVGVAFSALLVVGVLTFAGPCVHDDGSHAACYAASQAILVAGIVALVASAAGAVMRNSLAQGMLAVSVVLASAFAAASPGVFFPLCMMQTMRCHLIMRPFALVVGVVACICGIVAAVVAFRAKAGRSS